MLSAHNLRVPGLRPVELELPTGDCLALRGVSGSGKTRLLRAIADLDPSEGDVRLDAVSREAIPAPAWRRQVAYLATDAGWWLDRVGAHFADWSAIADDVEPLGLSPGCRDWPVTRLSTGERQRLALLRGLAIAPSVLLLDEPTSGLDAAATEAVERLIARRRRNGLAVLWVTHDAEQAERIGTRVLELRDGGLVPA